MYGSALPMRYGRRSEYTIVHHDVMKYFKFGPFFIDIGWHLDTEGTACRTSRLYASDTKIFFESPQRPKPGIIVRL